LISSRATSSLSRFVASERSLPKYLLGSGATHARIPFSRLIAVTAVSTSSSFPLINSLLHISCRRTARVGDRIRYRDIRSLWRLDLGDWRNDTTGSLCVPLGVREPGHPVRDHESNWRRAACDSFNCWITFSSRNYLFKYRFWVRWNRFCHSHWTPQIRDSSMLSIRSSLSFYRLV